MTILYKYNMIDFDINYLNHFYIKNIRPVGNNIYSYTYYICNICEMRIWYDGYGNYILLNDDESNGYVTINCDEYIIKNIIE